MSILPTRLPRLIRPLAVAVLLATSLAGCVTNPVTGRQGLLLLSEDEERSLGLQSFEEVMRSERLSRDPAATALVRRVGQRIAAATGRNDYQWEFRLVDKADINAFCLPGGKVVVYTGILPVTRDEAGLAAVVGHEVAHAIARHGGERVSQELLVGVGVAAVSAAVSRGDEAMSDNVAALLGAGVALGYTLPFSRGQESEADYMGLLYMAQAGYDPRAAIGLWQRMAQASKGSTPEFLSTHPSNETRIQQISAWIPEIEARAGRPAPRSDMAPMTAPGMAPMKTSPLPAAGPTRFQPSPGRNGPPSVQDVMDSFELGR